MHRNEDICTGRKRMGGDLKLPKMFDKPVTTNKCDYRFSHFLQSDCIVLYSLGRLE